ncbi:hypothetical protein DW653_16830 [Phocaeicola plebeius]|uniref:Uncharacterized protein n=1 Tax=Phocaeicola plebeius TaxID=310297 RepID=A0A414QL93_9BACT|nr:hypothetical protein DW653_16830 [Phocaeicola plebeius]
MASPPSIPLFREPKGSFISCYNMCSGYIASSLKCYHFRTCEGGKPPFNPPFQRAERLVYIML